MLPPLAGADKFVAPQLLEALAGSAIVTSAGKTSVKANPVSGPPELFDISKRNVLTLPGPMEAGEKALVKPTDS